MQNYYPFSCRRTVSIAATFVLTLVLCTSADAQRQPQTRSYTARELQTAPATYAILEDSTGLVYAANNDGIAVFDGAAWQLLPTPLPMRAVVKYADGRIIAGGINSLGYFRLNDAGRLVFADLIETLPVKERNIGEVLKIVTAEDGVYALTSQALLFFDFSNTALPRLAQVQVQGIAYAVYSDGKTAYVSAANFSRLKQGLAAQVFALPFNATDVLAVTRSGDNYGFVSANGTLRLVSTGGGLTSTISLGDIGGAADAVATPDGAIWVSGRGLGLYRVAGNIASAVRLSGVGAILGLGVGSNTGLWIGHTKGVTYLRTASDGPMSLGADVQVSQLAATPNATAVATTGGAFLLGNSLQRVAGTDRTMYDVVSLSDDRFVFAGEEGIILTNAEGRQLDKLNVSGIRILKSHSGDKLYVGGRTDIRRLSISGDELKQDSARIPVPAPVGSLAEDASGTIWIGTLGAGLRNLVGDKLKQPEGAPATGTLQVFRFGDQVYVRIKSDYFRITEGKLVPVANLTREAGRNSFFLAGGGQYLAISALRGVQLFQASGDSLQLVPESPAYSRVVQPTAASFAGSGLVLAYDNELQSYADLAAKRSPRKLLIRSVIVLGVDSLLNSGYTALGTVGYQSANELDISLPRGTAGIRLQVGLPDHLNPAATLYRYRIGNGPWTEWSAVSGFELANLPHGDHAIQVEARHASGYIASAVVNYSLPAPWYLSTIAFIGYGLVLLGLIWLSVKLYSRRLEAANQRLEQVVQERTEEISIQKRQIEDQLSQLAQQHETLEQTLEELKSTQEQLLQTEKMAALGQLVAGVAHEINTPVGVGVTAASHLQIKSKELASLLESGQMKKSDLTRFVEMTSEGTQIILQNLSRAADLIQSFKKVAVDQNVEEATPFDVKTYLSDIILSVRPKLKENGVTVELEAQENIEMLSYASALSQIMINLLMNAVVHAFESRGGKIIVSAQSELGRNVIIRVTDNGRGIPEDIRPRIFDPFFTTNRGKGGSGLGLHIVYNLVTQSLKGTIQVESTVGVGTTFTLNLPRTI